MVAESADLHMLFIQEKAGIALQWRVTSPVLWQSSWLGILTE
jgi:hypothetical protein